MADNVDFQSTTPATPADTENVRAKDRAGVKTQVVILDRSNGTATENLGLTGSKTFADPAPTSTAASVLAANTSRKSCTIQNVGTVDVYLGKDNTVTTTNGLKLAAGDTLTDDVSTDAWWGITASGTADLRVLEVA